MRYSKITGNFYPKSLNYSFLPDDIIDVSYDDYLLAMNKSDMDDIDCVQGKIVIIPKSGPTINDQWHDLQSDARKELSRSDITILRCIENGVAIPASWATYRSALRTIISATTGDPSLGLPIKPAYPAGT